MVWRSRAILLPEPELITNSLAVELEQEEDSEAWRRTPAPQREQSFHRPFAKRLTQRLWGRSRRPPVSKRIGCLRRAPAKNSEISRRALASMGRGRTKPSQVPVCAAISPISRDFFTNFSAVSKPTFGSRRLLIS